MNAQPVDLQTLHFRTAVLRNLIYHRALILEPIRRLAFRNMRHLSDAMADHRMPADVEVGSVEFNEWVRELQDRMLRDQGSEPSEMDRVLIQIATFTPVKLYLGLLYAEIEYLEKRAGEHPLSGNQDLRDFLRDNSDLIEHSKYFRDGMLHPSERSIPSEKAWIVSGFHHDLQRVQMAIDAIIREARETLRLEVESALLELPELQRWHCYQDFLTWLSYDDAMLLNDARYNQFIQEIERQNDEYPRILRAAESTQPADRVLAGCESTDMTVLAPRASGTATATPTRAAPATPSSDTEVDALALWDDNGNGRITCAEARAHGIAPVHRGHPAYQYMRDADGDGVVCE